jgi:hypothetical protein
MNIWSAWEITRLELRKKRNSNFIARKSGFNIAQNMNLLYILIKHDINSNMHLDPDCDMHDL